MNTYSFNAYDTDWLLLNPEIRKLDLARYTGWPYDLNTNSASAFALATANQATCMQDLIVSKQQQVDWTLESEDEPGAIVQNIVVKKGVTTSLVFAQTSKNSMVTEFNVLLEEGSNAEIRYINFSSHRQSHVRLNVVHSAGAKSMTRVINMSGKNASATAQVKMSHGLKSAGSSSDLNIANWNLGGRVGALPIIDACNNDVQAKHGTAYYTVDNELVFLLQLKGLRKRDAIQKIVVGSIIELLGLNNTFYMLNLEQCLTETLENSSL